MQDCTCSPDDGLFHCNISSNPNNGKSCVQGYKPGDPLYDGIPTMSDLIPFGVGFIVFLIILFVLAYKIGKWRSSKK